MKLEEKTTLPLTGLEGTEVEQPDKEEEEPEDVKSVDLDGINNDENFEGIPFGNFEVRDNLKEADDEQPDEAEGEEEA